MDFSFPFFGGGGEVTRLASILFFHIHHHSLKPKAFPNQDRGRRGRDRTEGGITAKHKQPCGEKKESEKEKPERQSSKTKETETADEGGRMQTQAGGGGAMGTTCILYPDLNRTQNSISSKTDVRRLLLGYL